jgi:hypothetical protein
MEAEYTHATSAILEPLTISFPDGQRTPVGNLDLIRVTKIEERMTEKGLGVALTTTDRVWELVPTDSNQVGEWMSTFYERCRRAQKPDKPTVSASNYATRHY